MCSLDRLAAFLSSPRAYPHDVDTVEQVQTHISRVFLAGEYVYKVKKPVSLGFLDFSTLDMRRHFCEQELLLNRRLCPDIYEAVVPISEVDGRFFLDDDRSVVEYAVRMRRLSGGAFANELTDEGTLSVEDLDRVAARLANFYAEEAATPDMARWGRPAKLAISIDENFEQTHTFAGSLISMPAYDILRGYAKRFFTTHARLLNERRAGGCILDCHGDLHLEHVYLTRDRVCIYDCIEFNERFRTIDVANDIAFLCMDLDFHDRPDLSAYVAEQLADRLQDPDILRLLDFYKCYRAIVRAKVEGIRSRDEDVDDDERAASTARARAYFQLAVRYATSGSQPIVLITMGRVGTGKSTLARALGEALGCDVISSDRVRKEQAGIPPHYRGTPEERAELYSTARSRDTYAALTQQAVDGVHDGRSIILDATYSKRHDRDDLRATLDRAGAHHLFLELCASDDAIRQRLADRASSGNAISDARLEDFDMLNLRYEAPDELEDPFHVHIDADTDVLQSLSSALEQVSRFAF